MHALFIAMRRLQPDLFFSKVNQYLVNSYDAPVVRHLAKGTEVRNWPKEFIFCEYENPPLEISLFKSLSSISHWFSSIFFFRLGIHR